jgi:PAS domain S-box-containing protein
MYTKLKDYEIISELHSEARTSIFRGKRISDGCSVIIKINNKKYQTNEDTKRLKEEFEIGNRIKSNNVIKYIDLINYNNGLAIIQEYFNGESIDKLNKFGVFDLEEFLLISIQICSALKKIHAENIIHGAINPSNVLYNRQTGEVKIINFSSAVQLSNKNYILEDINIFEGSLNYISPEQTGRMNRTADYRSDFYSLGITFYEMLTGKVPFPSKDLMELIYSHVAKEPEDINKINSAIPKVVSDIILKLIAKNPEDRYKSAFGLKKDFERCLMNVENNFSKSFKLGKYDFSGQFFMPQKLYGRDNEFQILMESFDRVREGASELFIIWGALGMGKSAIVHEFCSYIKKKHGYFTFGKFEQFQNDIPYSAIIQSLGNFINQLLMESSNKLEGWKQSILKAVGNNGQVIIDVIPALELIIGKQPTVSQLGAVENQNRFNFVFKNFIQIIATAIHPFVIFIDDLQWADSSSLNFLKMIITNKSNKHLLVVGAYRDNDTSFLYPITSWAAEMIQDKTITNTINLKELQKKDVQLLLEDTLVSLDQDLMEFQELADCIWNKTQGNPFFVKQFLRSLYDFGYLWFDYRLSTWRFNTEEIKKMNITENVIDLLNSKIKTLNPKAILWLKYAACIGNQFNLQTLALVGDNPAEIILHSLGEAVEIGLIYVDKSEFQQQVQGYIKFKFVHDRIQQAVYSMISEDEKYVIHLQLGQLYLKNCSDLNNSEQLFEIVRQLNAGSSIIIDEAKKVKLAELNLKAGIMAKKSSAYSSSYAYFNKGIKLLSNNTWKDYYDLTLQLHSDITEASYLINKYDEMDEFAETVLTNGKTLIDKIKVYRTKIEACKTQLNLKKAMKISASVLKALEIDIPSKPKSCDLEKAFNITWKALSEIQIKELINLPLMKDPEKLAAMEILLSSTSVALQLDHKLGNIIMCKMMELIIRYGNTPFAPAVYSYYTSVLCSHINDIELKEKLDKYIELAYRLVKISNNLVENPKMKQYKSLVMDTGNVLVMHWKEHIRETLKPCIEGYWSGVENGSFEYAGYCIFVYSKNTFYSGRNLNLVEKEIDINIKRLQKIQHGVSNIWINILGQTVQNLQGKCKNVLVFNGDYFDEDKIIPIIEDIGDIHGMHLFYLTKMMLNYYFQNYSAAIEYARKIEKNVGIFGGTIDLTVFNFYDSLIRLSIHFNLTKEEQNYNLAKIECNQAKMNTWSKLAPMNFLHKYYLVQAELYKISGNYNEAEEYYTKSISLAKENEYLNDEALAYELAGKFYLDKHKDNSAKVYLCAARSKYQHLDAVAKVKEMENSYPNFFSYNNRSIDTVQNIDLFSIMKASQAISSEINLDALLSRLMTVMIENMGAQRGFFILKRGDKLMIEAYVGEAGNKKQILTSMPVDECEELPKTVIRFTGRTGEDVIYPEKIDKSFFNNDTYIINQKPKSFISKAVKLKNEIKGILYLENNLIEGAFRPDRVKIIEILSAQAAISLENAMLYNTLEQNMKDKLRDSEIKLNITASSAGVGLWDWNIETGENIINEEWGKMLGYTVEELMPVNFDTWIKLIHPEDTPRVMECIEQCFSKKIYWYECELRLKHKSGDWVWIKDRGRVIEWDEHDKPIRMSGIHMNISERKKSEDELKIAKQTIEEVNILKNQFLVNTSSEESALMSKFGETSNLIVNTDKAKELERTNLILQEVNGILEGEIERYSKTELELKNAKAEADNANIAKSNFIANISHELRTPIAVILSGIQLIEVNINSNESENKQNLSNHIRTIKQNCYRLLRLVNNIIDVTKFDAGFRKLDLKNLNIVSLVEDITISVVEYAKLKGITIIFDTDEEEKIIAVDPDKIERILLNLLSNAIKFTPKKGCIFVKILNKTDSVIVSIEDTGIGVPAEKKEMIFEKFQQIDNTFTRKNEGSGIGLSIVKSFVELHDGKISLTSELGKGSKFIIEFPVKKLHENQLQKPQNQTENSSSLVDTLNIEFSDIYFD